MSKQYCPQIDDMVPVRKCNRCNVDLVGRTKYCCKYINCLTTCDYARKESCTTYQQKLAIEKVKANIRRRN
jgi:hypothetical protein